MKRLLFRLAVGCAVLVATSACNYEPVYRVEIGTQGEVLNLGLAMSMDREATTEFLGSEEAVAASITGPLGGPDRVLAMGMMFPERVTDEELAVAFQDNIWLGRDFADIGVTTESRVVDNGVSYATLRFVPTNPEAFLGTGVLLGGGESRGHDDGSVAVSLPASGMFGGKKSVLGEGLNSLANITLGLDVVLPYSIANTDGTVDNQDNRRVSWRWGNAAEIPDIVQARTVPRPGAVSPWSLPRVVVLVMGLAAVAVGTALAIRQKLARRT